jgi:hypothetical protein
MQENDLIFFDLIDNHLITYLEDDLIVIHNRKPKKYGFFILYFLLKDL